MSESADLLVAEINEATKVYRTARLDVFEKHDLHTVVQYTTGPVIGIGKRQPSLQDKKRTTLLQLLCGPDRSMLEIALLGAGATPAEINQLRSVLADLLQFLARRGLVNFSDAAFKTLSEYATDAARDEHWRTAALPVAIHHGDLVVLKSPTPNPVSGNRVQVVLAYRANPTAPLGAADISTGKPIPGFVLQAGRAAKLTRASAQHISGKVMRRQDIQHLLQHQMKRDAEKAQKLAGNT